MVALKLQSTAVAAVIFAVGPALGAAVGEEDGTGPLVGEAVGRIVVGIWVGAGEFERGEVCTDVGADVGVVEGLFSQRQ